MKASDKILLDAESVLFLQIHMLYLASCTQKSLFILGKRRRGDQRPLWLHSLAERKDQLCGAVSADHILRRYILILSQGFSQRSIPHLRIILNALQTVPNRLLHAFRRSKRIAVGRKIHTVSITVYVASVYVFFHSFSPILK